MTTPSEPNIFIEGDQLYEGDVYLNQITESLHEAEEVISLQENSKCDLLEENVTSFNGRASEQQAFIKKIPDRLSLKQKLMQTFTELGLKGEQLEAAAEIAINTNTDRICHEAWSLIPKYADVKRKRKDDGKKWDVNSHYKKYWKIWETQNLLYKDYLRKHDSGLVTAISDWCSRHGKSRDDYLPPNKSVRIDKWASDFSNLPAGKAVHVHTAMLSRAHKHS